MFKLNLKIALRNLFKNKVYAAINIGGLALGLTAFLFILLYINHEESYDKWSTDLKNIYQVRERHSFYTPDNLEHWQESNNSRVANLLKEHIPQIEVITKIDKVWSFSDGTAVKIEHTDPVMIRNIRDADHHFFHVFPYKFLRGDEQTALEKPNSIVLKEAIALQLFGSLNVLGKQVKTLAWQGDEGNSLTVTGVVAAPSTPETVVFNAITRTGNKDNDPENPGTTNYCQIYAKITDNSDTTKLNKLVQNVYVAFKKKTFVGKEVSFEEYYKDKSKSPGLKLVSLQAVHGNPTLTVNWLEKVKPIIAISIFLLLISIINFVNLATAQSVQRAKEVGVKKVLGSYKKQLIIQFLLESALQSVAALFFSVILIEVLLPSFNTYFNVNLSFWHNAQLPALVIQLIGLFLLVTLLAGFYPAWILSNYNPVSVLKGNYENGLKGIFLRNALVIFQFIISVTFMISIGVMQLQTDYINHKDLGFDKSKVINIKSSYDENFASKIRRIAGVQYVGTTTQVLGNAFNFTAPIDYEGKKIDINSVTVTMEALPALGVKVVEGRIFSPQYKADTLTSAVLNESAAQLLGKDVIGKNFSQNSGKAVLQIVGVIKDYHNEGFDKAVLPTMYKITKLGSSSNTNNMLVRFSSENSKQILEKIAREWRLAYPNYPMQYAALNDSFEKILEENRRFINMIVLFSVVSISLSLLGLFALSTFMAKRRTKEIAIRKILGASNLQLMNMLNRSFLLLVLMANFISWPIAFILTRKWLAGFAYRIDMPIWPFLIATALSVAIAIFTVSLQARKAAIGNPVNALKYE